MAAPGRRPRSTRVLTSAAALGGTLLLSSCQLPRFGAPEPASDQGGHTLGLWQGFFVAAIVVTLFVWVPLAFVLLKYRRTRRARRGDASMPSQKAYNIPMEIGYTVVPVLIVAVLFFFSVRTEHEVTAVSKAPAVRVEVIGFQWGWQFRYLGEGFTVDAPPGEKPQLVLPIGASTNLKLVSTDVNHSFWVPDFLSKRDLIPGVDNEITVTPNRAGTFEGRCAEFCGLDHWKMGFTVRIVPQAQFDSWLAEQKAAGGTASAIPPTTATTSDTSEGSGG
ncbi:cytochrome c oxidase subunit II [Aquihabitans sp. G128]|uniref:cytochrome c oxidase subunit II n=1 Tax=Aquihabitans sp. G128 TaxID=2849779 RepID=UPI001C210310|nr:cytochrome c oxidase subunit II [Aquihabitans sp. G128]QXC61526.1 cytochrome c oxidase subunit II [Aquihabitans sp. G128]